MYNILSNIKKTKYLAIDSHHPLQRYGDLPHFYHLEMVVELLKRFGFNDEKYIISGYLHDVIEDSNLNYNDLKRIFNEEIAEIIFCLSDNIGRNRKERKNYDLIKSNINSIIIKLADRIANVEYSKFMNNRMFNVYKKEYKNKLFINGLCDEMWNHLDNLLYKKI